MKHLFCVILVFVSFLAIGQNSNYTSGIRGSVVDQQSQFPIPGVSILVLTTTPVIGVATDLDGNFTIEDIPVGRHTIQVSFIGYETQTVPNILVSSGKESIANFKIYESIVSIDAAEIVASSESDGRSPINKMSTVSAQSFTVEEAARYSGSLQDPSRMAQNFAGVSNSSDDRNDIIIRGNSPANVLWKLEGIDIPSPNHFGSFGSTGGPVSMLNVNNLSNSDFMTGAFSADYGNVLSGVFDLSLRNGNKTKHEFLGQVGFNGFELGAEGPLGISENSSYLINARYSTLEVMSELGINFGTGAAIPQYKDITFKADVPTKKAGRFSLFGLGGQSYIEFLALEESEEEDDNFFSDELQDQRFRSNMGVAGIKHVYFFNEKIKSNFVAAISQATSKGEIDTLDTERIIRTRFTGFKNQQTKISANYSINKKISAKSSFQIGANYDHIILDVLDSVWVAQDTYFTRSDFQDAVDLVQTYFTWRARLSESTTLTTGLHASYFALNQSTAVEPRFGLAKEINPAHKITLGLGLHSMLQPLPMYFKRERLADGTAVLRNDDLDFNKAGHAVLGYTWSINENWRLKTEAYYQYLFNIAVERTPSSFSVLNAGADFVFPNKTDLENTGIAQNYGLEFTAERFYQKGLYTLITASLFESQYQGSDKVWRGTAFNNNYVLNVLTGKEFKIGKGMTLGLDTRVNYGGGRKYTPIDLLASQEAGQEVLFENEAFEEAYADYFRWDFKITFRMNREKVSQQFAVDLRNVTNQQNIFSQNFDPLNGDLQTRYQIGFFPDIQYKIYF